MTIATRCMRYSTQGMATLLCEAQHNSVTSARIDTGALRKALPDVAAAFTKESTVRRFCVA